MAKRKRYTPIVPTPEEERRLASLFRKVAKAPEKPPEPEEKPRGGTPRRAA